MLVVDDAGEVGTLQGPLPVKAGDAGLELLHKKVPGLSGDPHVIGGHTGLARVEEFAPRDAPGRQVQIGVGGQDGGGLAPQLQGHRGQMPGGGGHDGAPHLGAAGEEDEVKVLFQQGGVLGPAALDTGYIALLKDLPQQIGHRLGGGRGIG